MARNAIPTAYRSRLWPKAVVCLVMAFLLLLALRNPIEAAHWLRAVGAGTGNSRGRDRRIQPQPERLGSSALATSVASLKCREAFLDRLNLSLKAVDRFGQVPVRFRSISLFLGAVADVRTLALAAHDQSGYAQLAQGSFGGLDGHAVFGCERPVRGQLFARCEVSVFDCGGQPIRELAIRRPGVVGVERAHDAQHTSCVSSDGFAGAPILAELSKTSKLAVYADLSVVSQSGRRQQEAPTGVGAPAGAHIETLGVTMQIERTRLYRVRTVAENLDVSVATIYRAVESGALRAIRLGRGKGAVRIPGDAIEEYLVACQSAAVTREGRRELDEFAAGGAA